LHLIVGKGRRIKRMGKVFITFLGLTGLLCSAPKVWAQAPRAIGTPDSASISESLSESSSSPEFTKKNWSFETGFKGRKEGKDDGFASLLRFSSEFEMRLSPWLRLEASPYASYFSSRVQQRFDDDTYQTRLGLNYGHLTAEPFSGLLFKAGAIPQAHLDNSQLVSKFRSFPGGLGEYSFKGIKDTEVGLRVQYVIPTSSSLNTQRESQEGLPTFVTETLFAKYSDSNWDTQSQIGLFSWNQIPARVAFESSRAGNTPANADSEAETRLRYGYSGWYGSLESIYSFDNGLGSGLAFHRISNTEAPSSLADSQRISLVGIFSQPNFGVKVEVGTFFSEGDATLARYASSGYGNTNRKGEQIFAELDVKPYKFFLKGEYGQANELNQRTYQDDIQDFSVTVESYEFQF